MVDLLKIRVTDKSLIKYFHDHPILYWLKEEEYLGLDMETIYTKHTKTYKGILFEFREKYLDILFKPHYFFNNDLHNANDFSVENCIQIIEAFCFAFKVPPKKLSVINIEFGINVISPVDIKDTINAFKYHGRNQFYHHKGLPYSKESYTVTLAHKSNKYKTVKVYAKGLQYPLYTHQNTLRFEVKSKRSSYIKKRGINFIEDLLKPETYNNLAEQILMEFENVIFIYCKINTSNLTGKQNKRLKNYLNPDSWYTYLQKSRNVFATKKKDYEKLCARCDNNVKAELKKIIVKKLLKLKSVCNLHTQNNNKMCAYFSIDKGEICTNNSLRYKDIGQTKFCFVTGIDISMQSIGSIYLSNRGLKYYSQTQPEFFNNHIILKYLPKHHHSKNIDEVIRLTAKLIRTRASDFKKKQARIYTTDQTNLLYYLKVSEQKFWQKNL